MVNCRVDDDALVLLTGRGRALTKGKGLTPNNPRNLRNCISNRRHFDVPVLDGSRRSPRKWSLWATHPTCLGGIAVLYPATAAASTRAADLRCALLDGRAAR
jgi:hypothetical protein